MVISRLDLNSFRNCSKGSFEFGKTTAIVGQNGIGKTNILEAVRYLSVMKSFRAKKEQEVILFGQSTTRLVGHGLIMNEPVEVAVGLTNDRKQVTVNQVKKRVSQAVGVFKTVLFAPDDLDFVTGPPTLRRRFLDSIISQEKAVYLSALLSLQKIVKQRNATLVRMMKNLASKEELLVWDGELLKQSLIIQPMRKEIIKKLNEDLSKRYQKISGKTNSQLTIKYLENKISQDILNEAFNKDLRYGTSTIGPHHDDIELHLNKKSLALYGSRGELRSAVLSLKQAEIDVLTIDEPPILLLDDILSELDIDRQGRLMNLFDNQQTIITATHLPKSLEKIVDKVIEL
jgi:DNA replication and repair protein RecF